MSPALLLVGSFCLVFFWPYRCARDDDDSDGASLDLDSCSFVSGSLSTIARDRNFLGLCIRMKLKSTGGNGKFRYGTAPSLPGLYNGCIQCYISVKACQRDKRKNLKKPKKKKKKTKRTLRRRRD